MGLWAECVCLYQLLIAFLIVADYQFVFWTSLEQIGSVLSVSKKARELLYLTEPIFMKETDGAVKATLSLMTNVNKTSRVFETYSVKIVSKYGSIRDKLCCEKVSWCILFTKKMIPETNASIFEEISYENKWRVWLKHALTKWHQYDGHFARYRKED